MTYLVAGLAWWRDTLLRCAFPCVSYDPQSWCEALGEPDFVSEHVRFRRINRCVVAIVFPDSYSASFAHQVSDTRNLLLGGGGVVGVC